MKMNSPLDIIQLIKNPKQYVMNMVQQTPNPMLNNLVKMAEKNDMKSLESFARNYMKSQGKDFDQEFNNFKSMFNVK